MSGFSTDASAPAAISYELWVSRANEECLLRGLLRLMSPHLNAAWAPCKQGEQYDVAIVDDTDAGRSKAAEAIGTGADVITLGSAQLANGFHLQLPIRPYGNGGLIEVLNAYVQSRERPAAPPAAEANGVPIASLAGAMAAARQPSLLQSSEMPPLYLLPEEQRAYGLPIGQWRQMLANSSTPVYLAPCPANAIQRRAEEHGLSEISWQQLLWVAHTADPRVTHSAPIETAYRLKRWPDFATLIHDPRHAVAFLSGCSALALLETAGAAAQTSSAPTESQSFRKGILRSVLRRLGV